jgi:F-type H+-transporting ATPase subunit delta
MPSRSSAGKRYAEAVAGLARPDGSWERWRQELRAVDQAVADPRVRATLQSESHTAEAKRRLLASLVGSGVSAGALNLVLVMARRRRLELLPDVVRWFDDLADRAQNVRRVTVITAVALTDQQRERLRRRLAMLPADAHAGPAPDAPDAPTIGDVQLSLEVEPSILGGLVIRQGDIIQDFSVKARLESLRERLN